MSQRKKALALSSDSESDEELESNHKVPPAKQSSSESDSSDEEKYDIINGKQIDGSEEVLAGPSTQHRQMLINQVKTKIKNKFCQIDNDEPDDVYDIPTKLALIHRLKELNKRKTATHKTAVNKMDWSKVEVGNFSEEELKECLKQIMSTVCTIRTLDEMLNDYLENYQKYELRRNRNAPKLPINPCMRYVTEHREEFTKKLKKKSPNGTIKLGEVSKYGAAKFHKLPEKEQEKYKQRYKEELESYHIQRAELLRINPELKKKKAKQIRGPRIKKVKEPRARKEETPMTPFKVYYQEMKANVDPLKYQEIQQMYKNLGDSEKLKYINKLISLDTPLEKIFTLDEKKLMKHSTGMPLRPLSSYNTFLKEMNFGDKKLSMKDVSELWKKLSDEEKKKYDEKAKENAERWKDEMFAWIKTLPIEQQAEQLAKNKLLNRDRKRKRAASINVKEETIKESVIHVEEKLQDVESPKKKKKKNEEMVISKVISLSHGSPKKELPEKKVLNETKLDWDHVFDLGKTSSPKKDTVEKTLASFGPYPSLTTAHFFFQQKCDGKSGKKASKAYKNLSKNDKKKLFCEMNKVRTAYLAKMKDYALHIDPKHQHKVLEFHKTNKAEQESCLSWHKSTGTDNDDNSSSDDDSDDDSDDS